MNQTRPDWPRMMRRETAASYVDLSLAAFEREVTAGNLPMPVMLGSRSLWSRAQIDEAVDRVTGETARDWRGEQPGLTRAA